MKNLTIFFFLPTQKIAWIVNRYFWIYSLYARSALRFGIFLLWSFAFLRAVTKQQDQNWSKPGWVQIYYCRRFWTILILFFSYFQKYPNHNKWTILRWFCDMQNLLKMLGFIDIGPQSYEVKISLLHWFSCWSSRAFEFPALKSVRFSTAGVTFSLR